MIGFIFITNHKMDATPTRRVLKFPWISEVPSNPQLTLVIEVRKNQFEHISSARGHMYLCI